MPAHMCTHMRSRLWRILSCLIRIHRSIRPSDGRWRAAIKITSHTFCSIRLSHVLPADWGFLQKLLSFYSSFPKKTTTYIDSTIWLLYEEKNILTEKWKSKDNDWKWFYVERMTVRVSSLYVYIYSVSLTDLQFEGTFGLKFSRRSVYRKFERTFSSFWKSFEAQAREWKRGKVNYECYL